MPKVRSSVGAHQSRYPATSSRAWKPSRSISSAPRCTLAWSSAEALDQAKVICFLAPSTPILCRA